MYIKNKELITRLTHSVILRGWKLFRRKDKFVAIYCVFSFVLAILPETICSIGMGNHILIPGFTNRGKFEESFHADR